MKETSERKRSVKKPLLIAVIILLAAIILFVSGTFVFHRIKSSQEIVLLKERGYYNLVSVGDHSLNVSEFGNKNGKHTIVGLAGLGMGDYSVAARQMTACLEEDNFVVFVDRAGYGFSDDTNDEMTIEYIVEDYRKALKNAGIEAPYIPMPHSIGGAYANYWASNYPEEIEAVVIIDGSQLSENAYDDEPVSSVGFGDRFLAFLAKMGFSRFVLRNYYDHYPDNYSEEEQYLGDALTYMTLDSIAPDSESAIIAENGKKAWNSIITNDIPKLYICAGWGAQTKEDIIEFNIWTNRQIEINNLDLPLNPVEYDDNDEQLKSLLNVYEERRQNIIYPYAEKMGNCKVICLFGDHMIYEQKPDECGKVIKDFIDDLDS